MQLEKNTILITGGSSGIGLELVRRLIMSNKILICGRSEEKLEDVKRSFPQIEYFQCDLSLLSDCEALATWIRDNHPDCNVLINNAALHHVEDFYSDNNILEKANLEMKTNFLAPIVLAKLFIPLLEKNHVPNIINVTTGLVYAPKAAYPFYNSTKAALHSFTQVLRLQLEKTKINVIEVMFPAVDTPFHNGNPPKMAIPVSKAVDEMLTGLSKNKKEIKVAGAKLIYFISRIAPSFALKKINSLEYKKQHAKSVA